MSIPASGYNVSFTDQTTSGFAIVSRVWRIEWDATSEVVQTKSGNDTNPSFNLSLHNGPGLYNVYLLVTDSQGSTNESVDSFTVSPPAGTDDIQIGDAFAQANWPDDLRLFFPILRARDPAGNVLAAPATVQIEIFADGSLIHAAWVKEWGVDLASELTDPTGSYLIGGTLAEGGTISFQSQLAMHDTYKVQLTTVGGTPDSSTLEARNPLLFIMRSGGTPPGQNVSAGAVEVLDNLNVGTYQLEDVQKYKLVEMQFLQRLRQTDPDIITTSAATLAAQAPKIKLISMIRYDLIWYGPGTPLRPNEAWGSANFPAPTFAMKDPPRNARTWASMEATLAAAGWTQDPDNKAVTDLSGGIRNTYNLFLVRNQGGAPGGTWYVQDEKAAVGNQDWLELITDSYVLWRANSPYVEGYHVGPQKIQFADPFTPTGIELFNQWVDAGANGGWDLETDSPGSGLNRGLYAPDDFGLTLPNAGLIQQVGDYLSIHTDGYFDGVFLQTGWYLVAAAYPPDPNSMDDWVITRHQMWNKSWKYDWESYTVLDILEASWEVTRLLRSKDPSAEIVYDPLPLHVGWSTGLQNAYHSQWIAKYGGNAADAKQNYIDRQYEMKSLAHYLIQDESRIGDEGLLYIPAADRTKLRRLNNEFVAADYAWTVYPSYPQEII